jgi:hypothetical protein
MDQSSGFIQVPIPLSLENASNVNRQTSPPSKIPQDTMNTNRPESNPNNVIIMNDVDGLALVGDLKVGNDIHEPVDNQENSEENIIQQIIQRVPIRRSTREKRITQSKDYAYLQEYEFDIGIFENDPKNIKQAMKNSNSQKWIDVMNEKMKSMYDNDV